MRRVVAVGVVVVVALILMGAVGSVAASPEWMVRPGTIGQAVTLPSGSHVSLDAVEVDKIRAKQAEPYFTIHECFAPGQRLIVLSVPDSRLRMNQTVDVSGTITVLANGDKAITDATIQGYADRNGKLLYHGPLIKGLLEPTPWEWKTDLTVVSSRANTAQSSTASPSEPDTTPADAPDYYPHIADITGDQSSQSSQTQSEHAQDYYDGIPDLQGLPDGSLVELTKKRITGVGTETINGTDYKYLDISEDLPATDTIRSYYTADVSASDRVVSIYGQIRHVGTTPVICVDSGPDYDPQILEGTLMTVSPGKIMFAQTLPDGVSSGNLAGKIVSSNQTDAPNQLYITEVGNYAGIRVIYTGAVSPDRGMTVDVTGVMHTGSDGEREVLADETGGVTIPVQPGGVATGPYGMTNKALVVGTKGLTGLDTTGMTVRTWGKVTAVDSGNTYFYIDDGSAMLDGTGNTGVRITWPFSTITPPAANWYVAVTGQSGKQTIGTNTFRVLRPRSLSNPQDVNVFSPSDTTDPTVSITTPGGNQLHLAPSVASTVISGKAFDAETGVASVQVQVGSSGQFRDATYSSSTQTWTYTWQNPTTGDVTITAHATDFAGRTCANVSRTITVSQVAVIYVDGNSANAVDGANHGTSWSLPYRTVGYALTSASGTKDIWVARKTYTERITLKANVGLYGGFAGGETSREQRNWVANRTVLDGSNGGSVVTGGTGATAANCAIDGFTIQNGNGTFYYSYYSSYYYGGGGIYFNSSAATVSHNVIKLNGRFDSSSPNYSYYSTGAGIYCSSASPVIANNWIVGNAATNIGGAIYTSNSSPTIVSNTIADNSAVTGGAIYVAGTGSATITNNVIALNSSGVYISSGTHSISYNNVWGNATDLTDAGYWKLGSPETSHNISADPRFIDSPFGELHIRSDSPCRNAGLNPTTPVPDYMALDLDGDLRQNGQIDMGADEWTDSDPSFAQRVVRVSPTGDDSSGDSWVHAKRTIQGGIDTAYASGGGEVWVQGGQGLGIVYSEAINLRAFVHLYGGFDENDAVRSDRNWHDNVTAIDASGLALPVVTINTVPALTCTVDGFTIAHGDRGIKLNYGSATIAHNIIKANSAVSQGGGIYAYHSQPVIANNWIAANTTLLERLIYYSYGGGVSLSYCPSAAVLNNTVVGNQSITGGGGGGSVYLSACPLASVTNNIVAFNSHGILIESSTGATAYNNDLYSNPNDTSAFLQPGSNGNVAADPGFVDAAHCDFHITGSGCKDLGLDTVPLPDAFDIDGGSRRNGVIDIGADEWNGTNPSPSAVKVIRVKPDGNDANSGESWALAKQTIQKAVIAATDAGNGEVWVKGSPSGTTYYGSVTVEPSTSLYGGFDETDTDRSDRNWASNLTVIRGAGDVVTMKQWSWIDGFTVVGGTRGISCSGISATIANNVIRANNAGNGSGAGLYGSGSTLTVIGNVFLDNRANLGGAIYYASTNGQIANNTVICNAASSNGGGIYLASSSPALANNIFFRNGGGGVYLSDGSPTFTKNDVYGNSAYDYNGVSDHSADVSSDPIIPNIDWGDWHIWHTSQCRDPLDTALALPMDKDIDAGVRVYGPRVDIGADEWNGTDPDLDPVIEHPTRWQNVGVHYSCPLVADLIPGDNGSSEVAVISNTDGKAYVWRADGTLAWTSRDRNGQDLILDTSGNNTLSAADIDQPASPGNQHLELIAPSRYIHAFGYDAGASIFKPVAGWPVTSPYGYSSVAAAIGDANLDGTREIVAGDYSCYVSSWNPAGGSYLWRQLTGSDQTTIMNSSVALGDVNHFADTRRMPDVVIGSEWQPQQGDFRPLFAFCGDASTTYPGSGWPKTADAFMDCSPAIGLVDGDSDNDIAVGTNGGRLYLWLSSGNTWTSFPLAASADSDKAISSSPVIAELNGQRCVVVGCNNGRVYAMKSNGTPIAGWPSDGICPSLRGPGFKIIASPALADVMNTGNPQIVVGCTDGNVYALWADGNNHAGGPVAKAWVCAQSTGVEVDSTPTICSLDGTQVSMIVGSTDGIYKIDLYTLGQGESFLPNSSRWPWPTFHRDNARTGCQTTDTDPAPSVSASIAGKITLNNNPVQGAKVYIRVLPGLTLPGVYGRTVTRTDPMLSAGDAASSTDECDEGQYCLSQLPPNQTYRITVTDASGGHSTTAPDVAVTTGRTVLDIALTP